MISVFKAQWLKEKRNPLLVFIFCGISVVATLVFGNMNMDGPMMIDVFSDDELEEEVEADWIEKLNDSGTFEFRSADEHQARVNVREGRVLLAVSLMSEDYRIITASDNPRIELVEQHIDTVLGEELLLRYAAEVSGDQSGFRADVDRYLLEPPLTLQTQSMDGTVFVEYDMKLQLLFGFSLFMVMFTIGFKLNAILEEKVSGIWDRVILSPVSKTEMYLGHLFYSFLIGFLQVLIVFLIFRFGFGFDLGEHFWRLMVVVAIFALTTVAFVMLLTGVVRTPEQFNIALPVIVPLMPLISGVYMPPDIMTNEILLVVAEFIPLTHAMEALKGIAMYDADWSDVFIPVAKLLLIGVICMGVGINLVERRRV